MTSRLNDHISTDIRFETRSDADPSATQLSLHDAAARLANGLTGDISYTVLVDDNREVIGVRLRGAIERGAVDQALAKTNVGVKDYKLNTPPSAYNANAQA